MKNPHVIACECACSIEDLMKQKGSSDELHSEIELRILNAISLGRGSPRMKTLTLPEFFVSLGGLSCIVTGIWYWSTALGLIALGIALLLETAASIVGRQAKEREDPEPEQDDGYWHDCAHYYENIPEKCNLTFPAGSCHNCDSFQPFATKVERKNGYRTDCTFFQAASGRCARPPGRCLNCRDFDNEPQETPE